MSQLLAVGAARMKIADFVMDVGRRTMACRQQHHCLIHPFEHCGILSVLAARAGTQRILECGTAHGFATLWLGHGAREAHIDTIELDPLHAAQASLNFIEFGIAERVTLHEATFEDVLPRLTPGYDLIMFDGWEPLHEYLAQFERLIKKGGTLVSSNLHFARTQNKRDEVDAYWQGIYGDGWITATIEDGNTAISVKL